MYALPATIEEATQAMTAAGALAICGGTDVFPAHVGKPLTRPLVDLSRVAGLRGIRLEGDSYRFGAATTWTDILRAELPAAFDGLKAAAREVGSLQIQNRGSIGGNLCNASPAADGVPTLMSLDARVEIAAPSGRRQLALGDFITGYRETALLPGEILTAVIVPRPATSARSAFVKLGARRYLVISILMAAALVEKDEKGRIARAAVAVGAASPVARRLPALEAELVGLAGRARPSHHLAERHFDGLAPIDDVRATAAYRLEAARAAVGEALDLAAGVA